MSGKYNEGREAFAAAEISWARSPVVAQLVAQGYVFSPDHRAAVNPMKVVGESLEVPGRTIEVGGWLKCAKLVFRQVSGEPVGAVVFRLAEGRTLIFHCDEVANFPMRPNGGDIEIDIPERGLFRV